MILKCAFLKKKKKKKKKNAQWFTTDSLTSRWPLVGLVMANIFLFFSLYH